MAIPLNGYDSLANYGMIGNHLPVEGAVAAAPAIPFVNAPAAPNYVPTLSNAPGAPTAVPGLSTLQMANLALGGLQTLGGLWMANKQMGLAKKQFKMAKEFGEINLGNQMQSYNTALADRARSRGVMEGQTAGQVSGYIDANSLTRDRAKTGGNSVGSITAAALSNYNSYTGQGQGQSGQGQSRDRDPRRG